MPSKVRWRPEEPGRQWPHRQMLDRLANIDSSITFLLVELRALQKRVTKLEQRNEEPERQWPHRQMLDRLANIDSSITFLLVELRALQKRVTKLEQRNDDLAAAALRLAHNNMEEVREMEKAKAALVNKP